MAGPKVPEGFEKVEASTWDYKEDGEGSETKGVYVGKEEGVGDYESVLYSIEDETGKVVGVWGNDVLKTRFKNIKVGEEVIIRYLGLKESQQRKGASYHNFEVFHRVVPMAKVEE